VNRSNLEVSQLGDHDDTHTIPAYCSLRRLPKTAEVSAWVGYRVEEEET
jgi:hypothetical protein